MDRTRTPSSRIPADKENVYIYISGSVGRPLGQKNCRAASTEDKGQDDPNSSRFRIEVIKVPLAARRRMRRSSTARASSRASVRAAQSRAQRRRGRRSRAVAPAVRQLAGAARPPVQCAAAGGSAPVRCRSRSRWCSRGLAAAAAGAPARPGAARRAAVVAAARRSADRSELSAMTSPSIRRSAWPAARAAATACCSTSAKPTHPMRMDFVGDAEHVVLALGDVQQRRQEGALLRRVGRRIGAALPRRPTSSSGAPTPSSPSRTTRWCSRATTRCRRRRRTSRTASRTTARSSRCPAATSWCRPGIRAASRCSTGPIPAKPFEIAYFDRGPMNDSRLVSAGSWSVYWYNGVLVSSEIFRGLDVFELVANPPAHAERDRRGQHRQARTS